MPPKQTCPLLPLGASSATGSLIADGGVFAEVVVVAASRQGRAHAHVAKQREDAFAVTATEDGAWVIAALADGVGGSPHARQAAAAAVRAGTEICQDHLRQGTLRIDWTAVMTEVARIVTGISIDTPERSHPQAKQRIVSANGTPSTTLTIAIVPSYAGNGHEACVVTIGDSPAWLLRSDRWDQLLPSAMNTPVTLTGENAVDSLPKHPERVQYRNFAWGPDEAIVLTSDGFADALGGGTSPFAAALTAEWRTPPSRMCFLRDVSYELSTYDDDSTAIGIWHHSRDQTYLG